MRLVKLLLSSLLLAYSSLSLASVQILATRVIVNAAEKEQTFVIRNVGKSPSLVQLWLSDKNNNTMEIQNDLPLFITPPVGRINAEKRKVFRVFPTKEAVSVLPQDRESMFWINVLDIPEMDANNKGGNKLNMAFRTRIKLFYRPVNIEGTLIAAAEQLTWKKRRSGKGYEFVATNNSPFHITLVNIKLKHGDKIITTHSGEMLLPYASQIVAFKGMEAANVNMLEYDYISDLGAFINIKHSL